jgi:DNA-binding beta-propeller fold protein YncE
MEASMWLPSNRDQRGRLSRYWNGLVRGASNEELDRLAAPLDTDDLAVIERLRRHQRYRPNPEFVSRLERDLLREVAAADGGVSLATALPPRPGRIVPPSAPNLPHTTSPGPGRWSPAPLFTALLVIATLAIVFVVLPPRGEETEVIPVVAPEATPATPVVVVSPEVTPLWRTVPLPPVEAEFVWSIAGQGFAPQIAVDPNGNLWVIDGANGRFHIYGPDGEFRENWGEPGTGEAQFDFQRDDGETLGGIAFTPFHADEDFYVADSQNARIQQFDAERNFVRSWGERGTGDGQFLEPIGVTVSYDGQVYVIDAQRDDIQIFDGDGVFIRTFGGHGAQDGQFDRASWGALDPGGHFWVTDIGNDRLQQFDLSDRNRVRHRVTVGRAGSGDGELDQPWAVATDMDGRVYVADRGNSRVQVLTADGRFVSAIDGAAAGGRASSDPIGIVVDGEGNLYVLDQNGTETTVQKFRLVLP